MTICYMCDQNGTTREHVPPLSFFPEDCRKNLWTVRSCAQHNNDNALDVEYVRNSIALSLTNSGDAVSNAQERVLASFLHSPGLFNQMFRDKTEIEYKGQEVVVWRNDIERFDQIMKAIAYGVHFKHFKKKIAKDWHIFPASMHTPLSIQGKADGFDPFRELIKSLTLIDVKTPEPDVFQCSYQMWNEGEICFRFLFFLGFEVYVWTID